MEKKYNDEKYNGMSYGCFSNMFDIINKLDHFTRGMTFEERQEYFQKITLNKEYSACNRSWTIFLDGIYIDVLTLAFLLFNEEELGDKFINAYHAFTEDCMMYARYPFK